MLFVRKFVVLVLLLPLLCLCFLSVGQFQIVEAKSVGLATIGATQTNCNTDTELAFNITLPEDANITKIGIYVKTQGETDKNTKFGLYASNGTLVAQTGNLSVTNSYAWVVGDVSAVLSAQTVKVGIIADTYLNLKYDNGSMASYYDTTTFPTLANPAPTNAFQTAWVYSVYLNYTVVELGYDVACIGDSITAGDYSGLIPYPTTLESLISLDVKNLGVDGATTSEQLDNWNDYRANEYSSLVYMGGITDISNGVTLAVTKNNIYSIVSDSVALGMDTYVLEVLPFKNYTSWDASKQSNLDDLNSWLNSNISSLATVINSYAVFEYPDDSDYLKNTYDNGDGLHPNQVGLNLIAQLVYDAMNPPEVTPSPSPSPSPMVNGDLTDTEWFVSALLLVLVVVNIVLLAFPFALVRFVFGTLSLALSAFAFTFGDVPLAPYLQIMGLVVSVVCMFLATRARE